MFRTPSRCWSLILPILLLCARSTDAAPEPDTIAVTAINRAALHVSDLDRSLPWYQRLFGLPLLERDARRAVLGVGTNGFLILAESAPIGIARIGFAPRQLNPRTAARVAASHGAREARVDAHGLEFRDPAGIPVRLEAGPEFHPIREAPADAPLPLRDFNHFTLFVPDAPGQVRFYRRLFGLKIDTYQGPMPIIRVGQGNQFLAFVGGRSKAFVHHVCFAVDGFDPDRILAQLAERGVKPRGRRRGPAGPLESYVVLRRPDRGGAPEGTPELYLTDPDGILLQLQDTRYAGGGGYLGDRRGMPPGK